MVTAEVSVATPAAQAWKAWADPATLSQWFTDRARGEAREGASFTWYFDRFGSDFTYTVLAADEPRRLILSGSPPGRPPYVLEIVIQEEASGCRVRVINSGFAMGADNDEEFEGVESGWIMTLSIMKEYLEHHAGRSRHSFFAMQAAPFGYEEVLHYFTRADGLARWLSAGGEIGPAGSAYKLTLHSGESITGRVLAITSREVALSWEEIGGVLEMKAFMLGPRTRALCLRGCGWGFSEEGAARIEMQMSRALDRLVRALTGPGHYVH
jgi:uncharacterized protein YndB with AHSA1/START domain